MGVEIGATEGAMIGHIVGGHIGGISSEFSQSGCIRPLTHSHIQPALAVSPKVIVASMSSVMKTIFMRWPPLWGIMLTPPCA